MNSWPQLLAITMIHIDSPATLGFHRFRGPKAWLHMSTRIISSPRCGRHGEVCHGGDPAGDRWQLQLGDQVGQPHPGRQQLPWALHNGKALATHDARALGQRRAVRFTGDEQQVSKYSEIYGKYLETVNYFFCINISSLTILSLSIVGFLKLFTWIKHRG